jgi:uncharacterized protein YbaR (Trm112 family)
MEPQPLTAMPLAPDFLADLRCPETKRPLREGTAAEVETLNAAIKNGSVRNRAGKAVTEPVDGLLLAEGGTWTYPIRKGVPVLMLEESVPA